MMKVSEIKELLIFIDTHLKVIDKDLKYIKRKLNEK